MKLPWILRTLGAVLWGVPCPCGGRFRLTTLPYSDTTGQFLLPSWWCRNCLATPKMARSIWAKAESP
jgi:hypothetical protein